MPCLDLSKIYREPGSGEIDATVPGMSRLLEHVMHCGADLEGIFFSGLGFTFLYNDFYGYW